MKDEFFLEVDLLKYQAAWGRLQHGVTRTHGCCVMLRAVHRLASKRNRSGCRIWCHCGHSTPSWGDTTPVSPTAHVTPRTHRGTFPPLNSHHSPGVSKSSPWSWGRLSLQVYPSQSRDTLQEALIGDDKCHTTIPARFSSPALLSAAHVD